MNLLQETFSSPDNREVEFVTFYVGSLLLGAEISQVEEINRHLDIAPVAHSPPWVQGVVNLRGEVVTVVDLRHVLGVGRIQIGPQTRNVVINADGERIGLLVDRVADVVKAYKSDIKALPANLTSVQGRFFQGVLELEHGLLAVLNIEEVLAATCESA